MAVAGGRCPGRGTTIPQRTQGEHAAGEERASTPPIKAKGQREEHQQGQGGTSGSPRAAAQGWPTSARAESVSSVGGIAGGPAYSPRNSGDRYSAEGASWRTICFDFPSHGAQVPAFGVAS